MRSFCSQPCRQVLQIRLHSSHVMLVTQLPQYMQREEQSNVAELHRLRQSERSPEQSRRGIAEPPPDGLRRGASATAVGGALDCTSVA